MYVRDKTVHGRLINKNEYDNGAFLEQMCESIKQQ